jgi:acyl dehydratase
MSIGWDSLPIGSTRAPFVDEPLTITDFVRYQGASGDMNPIHHDPDFAQRAGYPGPFAVGMLPAGILASFATAWLGPERLRLFRVQFREQAWPGDILIYSGWVEGKRVVGAERFVDVELECTRQTGGVHLKGWATFVMPEEQANRSST